MLVIYPLDFSPVCSDQLSIYQEVLAEIDAQGAELVGISGGLVLGPQGVPGEARDQRSRCSPTSPEGRGVAAPTARTSRSGAIPTAHWC